MPPQPASSHADWLQGLATVHPEINNPDQTCPLNQPAAMLTGCRDWQQCTQRCDKMEEESEEDEQTAEQTCPLNQPAAMLTGCRDWQQYTQKCDKRNLSRHAPPPPASTHRDACGRLVGR